MNDNQFPDTATSLKADALPPILAQPTLTFAQVLAVVQEAPDLTKGVRSNMCSAVMRAARLMSKAGLSHLVDVAAINKRFLKLTHRQLGFKTAGSLSTFISNFGRSLRLAGFTIMPGRHQTALTPAWASLLAIVTDINVHRRLTRLFHVASEQGWVPTDITDAHIDRFRSLVQQTCLKSKADKVVRNAIKAWNAAHETISGWPAVVLDAGKTSDWYYSLPWATFPASLRTDVDAYLDRGVDLANDNFLDADVALPPLKPRTQANYRDALLRSASILVRQDVDPTTLDSIADLVSPQRVNRILMFLADRTSRKEGGLVGYVALVLYMASRDWVHKIPPKGALPADVAKLKCMFEMAKEKNHSMSDNTWRRLTQFDDPAVMDAYLREPDRLMRLAAKQPVDAKSAGQVRLALFMSISLDTLLRPGDVVELEHDRHLISHGKAAHRKIYIHVPAKEIKNENPFDGELRPPTIRMLELYLEKYRPFHMTAPSPWLFPRIKGDHWREQDAYSVLNDHCLREFGIDVTPHLNRALGGKLILDNNSGALIDVQQSLGHKQLATTANYYIKVKPADARSRYHDILDRAPGARRVRL